MFKNVAASFMVFAFDTTTNTPKTGDAANITAYVSKDYGAVTVLSDTSAVEMDATNAPGMYLFAAAQAETNADCLMVSGKSSTANIKVIGAPTVIYTRPTTGWLAPTTAGRTLDVSVGGEAGVDWANVGSPTTTLNLSGTTVMTATDVKADTSAIKAITDQFVFTVANRVNAQVFGMQASAIDASDMSAAALNEIADAVLDRNMATGTDSGSTTVRTVRQALRAIRNRWTSSGGTLTVFKEDDSTSSWTAVVTGDAAANPTVEVNPAGP